MSCEKTADHWIQAKRLRKAFKYAAWGLPIAFGVGMVWAAASGIIPATAWTYAATSLSALVFPGLAINSLGKALTAEAYGEDRKAHLWDVGMYVLLGAAGTYLGAQVAGPTASL